MDDVSIIVAVVLKGEKGVGVTSNVHVFVSDFFHFSIAAMRLI